MAVVMKCKMCGGNLNVTEGASVVECEYCGSKQTIPNQDNEKKMTLFARADRLRRANEFDKAAGIYENIVADFPEEAEAYWGLVLCRYGIEYVDDPATGKKIPTCRRSSFDSLLEDSDFEQACENADTIARRQYRDEAKVIENIRKSILEVSGKEEPYDIFICYKETDEYGNRTIDSVIAQDMYDALTGKGYRVFFSRISLEDKLGTEYEPYIFAALNSAKVMLVFGSDYEYFNAVWVKNEWSRFLALIASGQKKVLIPCYKNVDAYDMPREFARLQAQDMGKVGAVQDLLRGIEKIMNKETSALVQPASVVVTPSATPDITSLLERGYLSLEDSEWEKAEELFDKVLNIEPKCADAYLGLAMGELRCQTKKAFEKKYSPNAIYYESFIKNLRRAKQFGGADLNEWLDHLEKSKIELFQKRREYINKYQQAAGMIAAGYHTVGLKADGTVTAVGYNGNGQCNVETWTDIVAVSAGGGHTVGLRSDGTVVAVGLDTTGKCKVLDWADVVAVSAGGYHAVGLKSDGTAVAVVSNKDDQCNVGNWTDIVAVSAGHDHAVGLRSNGTVVAVEVKNWNRYGQCDVGDWTDIVAVSAGGWHTVGLISDGTIVAVGENKYGQCNVESWTNIVAVSAGAQHTVGLKSDGTMVAVGDNRYGQCDMANWTDIVAISAGAQHTVGLKSDGIVVAVGDYKNGKCNVDNWKLFNSINTLEQEREEAHKRFVEERKRLVEEHKPLVETARKRLEKYQVAGMIAAGGLTVGLKADGTVVAVGDYGYGQYNVYNVNTWTDIVAVSAGGGYMVGLKSDGTVVAVGDNGAGQCNVADWTNIVAVSAGSCHTVGLKSDGTVVAVGDNEDGQCNVADWTDIVAISVGIFCTVGLKSDGTVVTVGGNGSGECNVETWTDIVAVSAGICHTVGLKSDGTVVAVGDNEDGRCNVGNWMDIVAVSAGSCHTVGLKSDGTVVAVGDNEDGRCNVGNWTDIVAVFASWRTVGLKSNGIVVAVGDNEDGQCNTANWKLFHSVDTLKQEREKAMAERRHLKEEQQKREKAETERREQLALLRERQQALRAELTDLSGLFSGRRRKEIEAQLSEIEKGIEYYVNFGK